MLPRAKQYTIRLSTGEFCVDIDTESNVACAYSIPTITLKQKSVYRRYYMDSAIHEALHQSCPDLSEKETERVAADITEMLWKRGYRLPRGDK